MWRKWWSSRLGVEIVGSLAMFDRSLIVQRNIHWLDIKNMPTRYVYNLVIRFANVLPGATNNGLLYICLRVLEWLKSRDGLVPVSTLTWCIKHISLFTSMHRWELGDKTRNVLTITSALEVLKNELFCISTQHDWILFYDSLCQRIA